MVPEPSAPTTMSRASWCCSALLMIKVYPVRVGIAALELHLDSVVDVDVDDASCGRELAGAAMGVRHTSVVGQRDFDFFDRRHVNLHRSPATLPAGRWESGRGCAGCGHSGGWCGGRRGRGRLERLAAGRPGSAP